ncbi:MULTISPECIES: type II secretion system minor pseudopilin GspJ [Alkalimonas]|uniref:Type II secretion system protein J n=1 Tax=Alkalimonas mucilaginosa TaxID=3057676 RepID=A0ABU7JIC8_9GAMM|nr:type II secretion system minor pseudopilin GspJ [Alkalimonas sp. MEB004]MEE2025410.1 type II secretion system minor pseudopilin GspJ [Alkalimonas sp. MEB004]
MPTSCAVACRKGNSAGFTFIEMLLAIAIFAMVGMASFAVLNSVTTGDRLSRQAAERLQKVQFALMVLERDLMQISSRHIRIQGEAPRKERLLGGRFLLESDADAIAFSQHGWRNPGMILPRSELQSLGYRLQEEQLQRLYTLYPDAVTGTEPRVQVLLADITELEFRYLVGERWEERWADSLWPAAVRVRLLHAELGEIERVILLPDGNVQPAETIR